LLPLEGIRVLSFSTGIALPDFGKTIGELGADVIKVESSLNLDVMRTVGPDINNSSSFNESNRNKRSLGINLKSEKGRQIIQRLIAVSDIMAESFRGDVMRGFALDYENVRQIKPDIIYISSQGFGFGGPFSDYQAYGPLLAAMSGMLAIWAHPDDPYPVGSSAPLPDHACGKHLVIVALAALDYKRRTGKGQFIDMAQIEVAAAMLGESYLEYTYNNRIPEPAGNSSSTCAPYGCYRCNGDDEWCVITVFTDDEWQAFCHATGNPEWIEDHRFTDLLSRLRNAGELDMLVSNWTTERDAHEVMETLQSAGVAAGIVHRAIDDIEDPQLKWLNAIIELDHPVAGKRLYPNVPFKFSGAPHTHSTRAPLLGEHTYEICSDLLGMSRNEIQALSGEGVLEINSLS